MGLKEEMEDMIHLIAEPLNKEEYDIYSVETDCIRDVCELYNEDVTYGESAMCDRGHFACLKCEHCQRIKVDLSFWDGSDLYYNYRFGSKEEAPSVKVMCSTYKTHGNRVCTSHSIDYEELTDAVLLSIQREARKILSNDDVEELKKTSCRNRRIENIEKEIEFAEERKQRINKFKKKTYQSYLEELISKADYKEYTANYDKELEEIEAEISGLEKRREDDKELESEYQEWVDKFSEYVDIDKLTRGIVIELIERIDVSEDGSICIHYRFKNPYED